MDADERGRLFAGVGTMMPVHKNRTNTISP